ncbi:Ribose transport system permease protein RbsC [Aquisphaera giovannonii]|uniref:Ribose transport system permease protein RbsC n=1 Tax=Aquisphaera giovannonii TaxID=406548 RepID=A0A5B9W021_9BACT|nr:ABC transporter permease [Aquisphaera giovannonii]QEH33544.1 Ribose transport system permease protein RbsC [Aquisphaera giovannonii]
MSSSDPAWEADDDGPRTPAEGRPPASGKRAGGLGDVLGMVAVLAALVLLFGFLSKHFWTGQTARIIVNQSADLTVVAVGMTLVLVIGGIDLSVGSVLALAGTVLGLSLTDWGLPLAAAIPVCLGVGLVCGAINGAISVFARIPSFIVTLGMLEVARGAAYLVTNSETKYVGPRIEGIARPIAGLGVSPAFLAAVAIVVIGHVLLTRTVLGRYMVAVGTNEEAVRLSGIDPRPVKLVPFLLSGLLAGLGALFQVARVSSADPNGAVGMELGAIAAVVIGGTSLMGGRGSVLRTFLGVLVIATLQTGLAQIGASEPAKRMVTGAVIVLAVVADVHRAGWSAMLASLARKVRPAPRP